MSKPKVFVTRLIPEKGLEVVREAVPRFGERDMSVLAEHLRQSKNAVRQEEELV